MAERRYGNMVYCIAEVGINANGDLNLAKELISTAAKAGCDAVKFQKRTVDLVYSKEELDKPRDSPWGTTTRQQKEGIEFSIQQFVELENHARHYNIDFIMSCWDLKSLEDVEAHLDVDYYKIASAMLTHKELLLATNGTGIPVILSTGMSTEKEIDKAVSIIDNLECILACTSTYPTLPEEINLKYINTLKEKYPNISIGFSNHYSGAVACFGAVALGAEIIEFHITKDRTMYGSDQAASIEYVEGLVDGIRHLEMMLGNGKKKVFNSEMPIKDKLRKVNTL